MPAREARAPARSAFARYLGDSSPAALPQTRGRNLASAPPPKGDRLMFRVRDSCLISVLSRLMRLLTFQSNHDDPPTSLNLESLLE